MKRILLFALILQVFCLCAQEVPDTNGLTPLRDTRLLEEQKYDWARCADYFIKKGLNQYRSGNFKAALDYYEAASECRLITPVLQDSIGYLREEAKKRLDDELNQNKTNSLVNQVTSEALRMQAKNPTMALRLVHEAAQRSANTNQLAVEVRAQMLQNTEYLFYHAERKFELMPSCLAVVDAGKSALIGFEGSYELGKIDLKTLVYTTETTYSAPVRNLKVDAQQQQALIQTGDRLVHIRDMAGHVDLGQIAISEGKITDLAWSAWYIAVSLDNGRILLYASQAPFEQKGVIEHADEVTAIEFLPGDTPILAVACRNFNGYLWNLSTRKNTELSGHSQMLRAIAVQPAGQYILTAANDGWAIIWSENGTEVAKLAHQADVLGLEVSANSGRICTWSADGNAWIWDKNGRKTGQVISGGNLILAAEIFAEGADKNSNIGFGKPSGPEKLVTLDNAGYIRLWRFASPDPEVNAPPVGSMYSVAWHPDGRQFLTGGEDRTVRLWDAERGSVIWALKLPDEITGLAVLPDGNQMLATLWNGWIYVLDKNGHQLAAWKGHKSSIYMLAVAPDGKSFLTASRDGTGVRWSRDARQQTYSVKSDFQFTTCAYHPTNQSFLFTDFSGVTYRADPGGKKWPNDSLGSGIQSLTWNRNGTLALLVTEQDASILDGSNLKKRSLLHSTDALQTGAWSQTSDTLVLATKQHDLLIYLADGQLIKRITGAHAGQIREIKFAPDGETFLTTGYDGLVKSWLRNGVLNNIYRGHGADADMAAFDAQTGRLASVSFSDKSLITWTKEKQVSTAFASGIAPGTTAIAYDAKSGRCVSGNSEGALTFWDESNPGMRKKLNPMGAAVVAVRLLGKDSFLVCDAYGKLHLHAQGQSWVIADFQTKIAAAHFSRDGNRMAAIAYNSDTLYLFDRPSQVNTRLPLAFKPSAVALSPDPTVYFLADGARLVRFEIDQTTKYYQALSAGIDQIDAGVAGQVLTVSGGAVQIWDASKTTEAQSQLHGLSLPSDAIVQAWLINQDELVVLGKRSGPVYLPNQMGRLAGSDWYMSLTPDQRKQYHLDLDFIECLNSTNPVELRDCASYFQQISLEREMQKNAEQALRIYDRLLMLDEGVQVRLDVIRFISDYVGRLDQAAFRDLPLMLDLSARALEMAEGLQSNLVLQRNMQKQMKTRDQTNYAEVLWSAYWNLSWYQLLNRRWIDALRSVEMGLAVPDANPDSDKMGQITNKALALLFTADAATTEEFYKAWAPKPWVDNRFATFAAAFLADLAELEKPEIGLTPTELAKIGWAKGVLLGNTR